MIETLKKLASLLLGEQAKSDPPQGGRDSVLLNFQTLKEGRKIDIPWTRGRALPGVLIFGKSGSGKTSGPGRTIARALLEKKMGGLVLCAKTEEGDTWVDWANEAGRAVDVVRVVADGPHRLNILDYENQQHGATTLSIVALLMLLGEAAGGADRKDDDWLGMVKTLLTNAVDLCRLAGVTIKFETILALVQDPNTWEPLHALAKERDLTESQRKDLAICAHYWGEEWLMMPDKTKGSIKATLLPIVSPLSRGELRELFSTDTTVTPEATFAGKIIIIDLPIKKFDIAGKLAAVGWKLAWQRAVERRGSAGAECPAFLWADEFQNFVTSRDADFCLTARASGGLMVLLTQGLPGIWHAFGGKARGESPAEILLGNLPTKIFCANDDHATNEWAQRLIGKRLQMRANTSSGYNFSQGGGGGSGGSGSSEQMDYIIETNIFQKLSQGGSESRKVVTAILVTGKELPPEGEMFCKVGFKQN